MTEKKVNEFRSYKITYFMYPEKNVVIHIHAKDENDAIIFARQYRNGSFKVDEE